MLWVGVQIIIYIFLCRLLVVNGTSISVNDEPDQFGNNGPVIVDQTKEEREAKAPKVYLGNSKVVWTNGTFPEPVKAQGATQPAPQAVADKHDDIPF